MSTLKRLPTINFILWLLLAAAFIWRELVPQDARFEELQVERLSIVGPDGHLYIAISNPERQAMATTHGVINDPDGGPRDIPGIIFFNRVGDEIGGIIYDGTDTTSTQTISFDQQKNDQVMVMMKDEYLDGEEWKRFYGLYFRERMDGTTNREFFDEFRQDTVGMSLAEQSEATQQFYQQLWGEIDVYRMFLGREENEQIGLFIYDSKGRERLKLYVDENDEAKLVVVDSTGLEQNFLD
ncbi:MAG: hypothetical protein AAF433_05205 [Bacteroidota bacterium]